MEERISVRVVDVYLYRSLEQGRHEFLLLHRAAGRSYEGQWRMVGGKIRPGEMAWQTALREVKEEVGYAPARLWCIPSINSFYEWQQDRINLIPAFAAELVEEPVLNHEHTSWVWLAPDEAARRLAWPEQRRLLLLCDAMLRDGIPPELAIDEATMHHVARVGVQSSLHGRRED